MLRQVAEHTRTPEDASLHTHVAWAPVLPPSSVPASAATNIAMIAEVVATIPAQTSQRPGENEPGTPRVARAESHSGRHRMRTPGRLGGLCTGWGLLT